MRQCQVVLNDYLAANINKLNDMVRKFILLLDGNGQQIGILNMDARFGLERCFSEAFKEVKKLNDKRVQFVQLTMGSNSLVAKPILSPKRITPERH